MSALKRASRDRRTHCRGVLVSVVSVLLGCSAGVPTCRGEDSKKGNTGPVAEFVTGRALQAALEQPLSVSWERVPLRTAVARVCEARKVAYLLDRRIDPTRLVSLTLNNDLPRAILARLLESQGDVCQVGNVLYLGPVSTVSRVRTLVALRGAELHDENAKVPENRQLALSRRGRFVWQDLDSPVEILTRTAAHFQLEVEGLERVPHDLWGRGEVPEASVVEALSLVLVQFDLGFVWLEQGRGIRVVPLPERLVVTRLHAPARGLTAAQSITKWRNDLPGATFRDVQGQVEVTGTIEDHERIAPPARPVVTTTKPKTGPGKTGTKPTGIEATRYSLRIKDVPVSALMKRLSQQDDDPLVFLYDEQRLKAAGVDLQRRISFEVKDVTLDELLHAAFDPLPLKFTREDRTVRLGVE